MEIIADFVKAVGVTQLKTLTEEKIKELKEFTFRQDFNENQWRNFYTNEGRLLDKEIFKEVREEIIGEVCKMADAYGHEYEGINISNSWSFSTLDGDPIFHHNHPNGYFSGVFYLTDGAPLHIIDHSVGSLFFIMPNRDPNKTTKFGNYRIKIDPKPGMLVLFPAGMYHEVTPYKKGNTRLSIAFNTHPYGDVGISPSRITLPKNI